MKTPSARRKAIARKLRGLLAMSKRAPTEVEAIAFGEKAAELMAEYGMTYSSVEEIDAETFVANRRPWFRGRTGRKRAGRKHAVRYCLCGIAELCGVEHCWYDHDGTLLFFGIEAETATAHYFVDMITNAIDSDYDRYDARTPRDPQIAAVTRSTSFKKAMAIRIGSRLEQMARDQSSAASTGSDLVVLKRAMVTRDFDSVYRVEDINGRVAIGDRRSAVAGMRAGDKTPINRGVSHNPDSILKIESDKS